MKNLVDIYSFPHRDTSQVGNFKYLTQLDVAVNSLSGPLTSEISTLNAMQYFDISNNFFSGSILQNIGDMRSLEVFMMQKKFAMFGTIPSSIVSLGNIKTLNMYGCGLQGEISAGLGRKLDSLSSVNVDDNNVCYPTSLTAGALYWNFSQQVPRCLGNEDIALCDLVNSTDISSILSRGYHRKIVYVETNHPYSNADAMLNHKI